MKNSIDNIEKLIASKYTSLEDAEQILQVKIEKLEKEPASEYTDESLAKKRSQLAEVQKKLEYEQTKKELADARLREALEKRREKEVYNYFLGILQEIVSQKNRFVKYESCFLTLGKSSSMKIACEGAKEHFEYSLNYEKQYAKALSDLKKVYKSEIEAEKLMQKSIIQKRKRSTVNTLAFCGSLLAIDKMINARPRRR